MNLSWETLAYQWIIADVFHSNETFAKPTCISSITLVYVVCVFERHRFSEKKLVLQNDALRNVHLIWFCDTSTRSVFRETTIFETEAYYVKE